MKSHLLRNWIKNSTLALAVTSIASVAGAAECITYVGTSYCEGDRVFAPLPKSGKAFFGVISKVEQPVPGDRRQWGNRIVTFEDGSTSDDSNGYTTFYPASAVSACGEISGKRVCKGETVSVSAPGGGGVVQKVRVVGIAKEMFGPRPAIYGEVLEGGRPGSATSSAVRIETAGKVPGFEQYELGQEIPNAYGSQDIIRYFQPAGEGYGVWLGELGRVYWMNREKLQFRLSNQREAPISMTGKGNETIPSYSEKSAIAALQFRAELFLERQCEDQYFTQGTAALKDVKFEVRNLAHQTLFSKYVSLGHAGGFRRPSLNPEYEVTGDYTITASCVHR